MTAGWDRFLSPDRYRRQPVAALLDRLPTAAAPVLEVGCGPGFVTVPAAERMGDGWLAAVDPVPEMLRVVQDRAAGLPVRTVCAGGEALPFGGGVFGRVFLVNLLHEVAAPAAVLAEAHRCLAPGGDLCVVDFEARPTAFGPPVGARIPRETMEAWLEGLGGRAEFLPAYDDFYAFRLEKR